MYNNIQIKFYKKKYDLNREYFITKEREKEEVDKIIEEEEINIKAEKKQLFIIIDEINDIIEEIKYIIYDDIV